MDSDNPYASPRADVRVPVVAPKPGVWGAWRQGELLIVSAQVVLPDRCVKCNAPAEGYRRRVRLSWHSPVAFLGLIGGLLPYIILALLLTNRLSLEIGVCAEHRQRRRAAVTFTTLIVLGGVGLLVAATLNHGLAGYLVLGGVGAFLIALIFGIVTIRVVWPKKIDANLAWVKGVSPDYLAELPEFGG